MSQTNTRYYRQLFKSLGVEAVAEKAREKEDLIWHNFSWLMNKTMQMFTYDGLPATIPIIALERILQFRGSAAIWNVPASHIPVGYGPSFNYSECADDSHSPRGESNLYAFPFTFANAPDPYDEPYQVVITSPGFKPTISEELTINKDVIIMRNDSYYQGLYALNMKYAKMLAEAEVSFGSTIVLLRDQMTFIVKTERQKAAVSEYIKARENGEFAAIMAPEMANPLELVAREGRGNAVELAVNGIQAVKAAWLNELGLNPSMTLKREYTSAQEIDQSTDTLMPIIDDMLWSRQQAVDSINAMFGTNITVRKNSAWEFKEREVIAAVELEEAMSEEGGEDNVAPDNSDSPRGESDGSTPDSTGSNGGE